MKNKKKIFKFCEDNGFKYVYGMLKDVDKIETFEQLIQGLDDVSYFERMFEMIWDDDCMEYLSKNDPSLEESVAICEGLEINAYNLGNALMTENMKRKFKSLEGEITRLLRKDSKPKKEMNIYPVALYSRLVREGIVEEKNIEKITDIIRETLNMEDKK